MILLTSKELQKARVKMGMGYHDVGLIIFLRTGISAMLWRTDADDRILNLTWDIKTWTELSGSVKD